MQPPIIETARLRLRGHRVEDLPHCVAMWSDPNVTKFIGGRPSTEQQTWTRLLSYVGHWDLMGFGFWAIEEKASGNFIGETGFADFKRDVAASMRGKPELGFALTTRFQDKGYATEAVQAALKWADAQPAFETTVCMMSPRNVASRRVAEKSGYSLSGEGLLNGQAVLFFSRGRS